MGDCHKLTERVTRLLDERAAVPPVSQYTLAEMLEQTLQLYEEVGAGGDAASASAA